MSREARTPLILWICAGIVFHMVCKDGAEEVAQVVEDRANIRALVQSVREGLRPEDTTFEVLIEAPPTPSTEEAKAPEKEAPEVVKPEDDPEDPKDAPKPKPAKVAEKKPAEPPKAEEKKAEAPPPPPVEEQKVAEQKVEKKAEEQKPAEPLPPPPPPDHRIAIRQHVEPDQKDNPNASRIADQANTVQEETVAKLRSHDHDDPDPNAGAMKKPSPTGDTGNNDHDKVAQSEEKPGTDNAPGESKAHSTSAEHHHAAPPAPEKVARAAAAPPAIPGGKAGSGGNPAPAQASPPPSPGGAGPSSPEVVASEGGTFTLDPANPGGDGKSKHAGRRRQPAPYQSPVKVGSVGLGAPGQPGGPNLNLSMAGVEAAVGLDQLKAERAADGAARRSAHRGKWDKNNFGRYRAAIENYEPSVKLGNQTALNAAQVPFATYLNTVHNRLHPIFAEEFLASLDNLPSEHALNKELVTYLEVVLSKDEGKIVRMGVTRASGVTAFDIVALNAFQRASPYGKAPEAIVSGDGNVYLHWEFHRDPFDACTTRNAFPYLLPAKGGAAAPVAPPRPSPTLSPTDERRTPPPLLPLRTP